MARVITFYSYKGGSGRSMALANVAWVLASNGERVLVIDWDLEAPGLHRYFAPFLSDKHLTKDGSKGVIDFVIDYAMTHATPNKDQSKPGDWLASIADLSKWSQRLTWPSGEDATMSVNDKTGLIDFVPAGKQGPDYAKNVNLFDFGNFYRSMDGASVMKAVKANFARRKGPGQTGETGYDYVLIDSRTGVSDTAGICTVQMPDQLVVCFTLNNQGILGAEAVVKSVRQQRPDMPIFPVPTRVDSKNESELAATMLEYVRSLFKPYLDPKMDANEYWLGVEFNYQPRYAFAEVLAPFEVQLSKEASLLPAVEALTGYLAGSRTPMKLHPLPENERKLALEEFRKRPETVATSLPSVTEIAPWWRRHLTTALALVSLVSVMVVIYLLARVDQSKAKTPAIQKLTNDLSKPDLSRPDRAIRIAEAARIAPDNDAVLLDSLRNGLYALGGSKPGADLLLLRVAQVTHQGPVHRVLFSPDSNYAISTGDDQIVHIVGMDGKIDPWTAPSSGGAIAISRDGYLVTCAANGACTVFSFKTHQALNSTLIAKLNGPLGAVAFSSSGRHLFLADPTQVTIYEVDPWTFLNKSRSRAPVWDISVAPDAKYYAAASLLPPPAIYCKKGGSCQPDVPVATLTLNPSSTAPTRMVVFSPVNQHDLRHLATAGTDHIARIWETTVGTDGPDDQRTPHVTHSFQHEGDVYVIAYSPGGDRLATGSTDGRARIWDVKGGTQLQKLSHGADVRALVWSSDARMLATGSGDGMARVWDPETGKELGRVAFDREVNSVALSADKHYLAIGSTDSTASAWRLLTPAEASALTAVQVRQLACLQAVRNLSTIEWQGYHGTEGYQKACPDLR